MKYVHIGLGKTGTTFLQEQLFPKISSLNSINFYNKISFADIKNKNNFFLSNENLAGEFFNSSSWKNSLEKNLITFGNDTNIIITIREPIEYFTSAFCQSYHAYNIVEEDEFFLNNEMSNDYIKKNNFYFMNYEKFSYLKLINLYTKNFNNVYIIKYENIKDLSIWSKVFQNDKIEKLEIKNIYKNKSFSNSAMKLTLLSEKFLKLFNTSLFNIQNKVRKIEQNKFLSKKFRAKLSYELRWRYFIQNRFDKLIPYKKYTIKNQYIKKKIIEKDNGFYKKFISSHYNYDFQRKLI